MDPGDRAGAERRAGARPAQGRALRDCRGRRWLRRGLTGIAIDPRKRDVLVARLRVLSVDKAGNVSALVTGQTTAVTTSHVVLMQEEPPAWFKRRTFWGGMVLGVALGAAAGSQF